MESTERVTWEDCPNCRKPAAVGWSSGRPIGFDCPHGCRLSAGQVEGLTASVGRPPIGWLTRQQHRL
jgi:hypothetical protein